ncbi:MAG: hypothetical protein ABDH23_06780 [Endomicrobiia bacterium]
MKYFIIVFFCFLIFNCATTKVPIWVKEFGTRSFSKDGIEGIGFAKFNKKDKSSLIQAREAAYSEAIKNLSIKLKTEIKGTIQRNLQDKIIQVNKKYKTESSDQIEMLTDVTFATILGRKYCEEYIDYKHSLYWVYVWTTKSDMQKAIIEELKKQEEKNIQVMRISLSQLKVVDDYLVSGKVLAAVNLLNQVFSQLKELKGITFLEKTDNISLAADVEFKLNKIFSSLEIIPLTLTNIEVYKDQPLNLEVIVRTILKYDNREIPVNFFPLSMRFLKGSGEIETAKHTDPDGIARFRIYKFTSKENILEISPNLDEIEKQKVDPEKFSQIKINYTILAKSIKETKKILVKIKKSEESIKEFLKNEIISYLKSAEFNISDNNYDYILEISCELDYMGDKITLPDGTQKPFAEIYSGDISFEIKNLNNDIILGYSFSSIKGFGKTKKEAQQNASKKLAELLANYVIENFK